jgi:hypothetical protein
MGTTLGEIARLAGISKQAAHKAGRRGFLDFDDDGHPDLNGAKTKAWLARQRAKTAAPRDAAVDDTVAAVDETATTASTLAGLNATLHGRLYDFCLWQANTCGLGRVRAELHDDADYWLRRAQALPAEVGCHIALLLGVSPVQQVTEIDAAMTAYLARVGDQHQRVEDTIAKIQASWIDHPIRRVQRPPQIPEFAPPATVEEARARLAMARGDLVAVRMKFRSGELLATAAVRFAVGDLRIRWRAMLAEEFAIGCAVELFPTGSCAWGFAQICGSTAGDRLSSYWGLGFSAGGNFAEAVRLFTAERWRRHGHYPTAEEAPSLQAADRLRVEEAQCIRRERLP